MSDALAIAAVTRVLMGMLENIEADYGINSLLSTNITVSSLAPNRIVSNDQEIPRINLFLYRVVPNPGWCNRDLPSRDSGGDRVSNPSLALDLYYLVSVYGNQDLDAGVLLGCAAQVFHVTPVITRNMIITHLDALQHDLKTSNLDGKRLADQIEQIRIVPVTLSTEEISKLWTAFQAPCRPAIAYHVSVVLIDSYRPARSNLPVLSRGEYDPVCDRDEGAHVEAQVSYLYPTLIAVKCPGRQPGVQAGETVVLEGYDLSGTTIEVECRHPRMEKPVMPVLAGQPTGTAVSFVVPDIPFNPDMEPPWLAGMYSVRVKITRGVKVRVTNALPLPVVPAARVKNPPAINPVASWNAEYLEVSLDCMPPVLASQDATMVIGDRELPAVARTSAAGTITFRVKMTKDDLGPGEYFYRIRIDGVESRLTDNTGNVPRFIDNRKVTIPP